MSKLGDNPRYACYAKAHGNTPEEQLESDGNMVEYILWNSQKIREFRDLHPEAFCFDALVDHKAYDAWLENRVNALLDN